MTISRNQLRAARVLLSLSQEELAALSAIGVATIRRYEAGATVSSQIVATLREAAEAAGAVFLDGREVVGREIDDGVALASRAMLPEETLDRMARRSAKRGDGVPLREGRPNKVRG